MQFGGRLVDRISKGDDGHIKRSTAQLFSLYSDLPQEEHSLDEFEPVALERLQLLRGIEQLKTRGFVGSDYESRLTKVQKFTALSCIPLADIVNALLIQQLHNICML